MKVLNLRCAQQHVFEGWFASEQDFQDQLARGLVACPLCSDTAIQKMLTAPRLNLSSAKSNDASSRSDRAAATKPQFADAQDIASHPQAHDEQVHAAIQGTFIKGIRQLLKDTDDVGTGFAEEARRMHYGEKPLRNIRGQATATDAMALVDEGIDVMPIPMLDALKQTLQ